MRVSVCKHVYVFALRCEVVVMHSKCPLSLLGLSLLSVPCRYFLLTLALGVALKFLFRLAPSVTSAFNAVLAHRWQ